MSYTSNTLYVGVGSNGTGFGHGIGGGGLTNATIAADTTWSNATITANGALIYNSTQSDKAVAVLAFGGDKTSTNGDFTIIFPTADASNAIIRIA
jgi:hypothetical protein